MSSIAVNRSALVAGWIVALVGCFAIADVVTRAWSSRVAVGALVGAALALGVAIEANARGMLRLVNRTFFPKRYAATIALDGLRRTMREERSTFRDRAAIEIAARFGLSSVAIVMRTFDGGFVRQVAFGWPAGTAWHVLPGEPLSIALATASGAASVATDIPEIALPVGEARPVTAVAWRRHGRTSGAVLLGRDEAGNAAPADVVRGLGAMLGEVFVD